MKTSELLLRAKEIMLERGKAYGYLETDDGRVCLLGALGLAGGEESLKSDNLSFVNYQDLGSEEAQIILAEVIKKKHPEWPLNRPHHFMTIYAFNDGRCGDPIEMLDEAAKEAKELENEQ